MTSKTAATTRRHRYAAWAYIALTPVLALSTYLVVNALINFHHASMLQPPAVRLTQPPEHRTEALYAIHHLPADAPRETVAVTVHNQDTTTWQLHLQNLAVSNGWVPHNQGVDQTEIILPQSQLDQLKSAAEDPYQWIETQQESSASPQRPPYQHPAKATVITNLDQRKFMLLSTGAFTLTVFTLISLGMACPHYLEQRRRNRHATEAETGNSSTGR